MSSTKSVLFFAPFGWWQIHHQVDTMLAAALRARDCKVQLVTCDAFYQPCAMNEGTKSCDLCQHAMSELISPLNLPSLKLGKLIRLEDVQDADSWIKNLTDDELAAARYGDLPIGEWAISTVMTQFRVSSRKQLRDSRITPIHRRFLRDTFLTYRAMDRLLDREPYDVMVVFNARFYPYRAAYEAARRHGLRLLVHERGPMANSFSFFEDETIFGVETAQRLSDAWSDIPLTKVEAQQLETYFSQRLLGGSANWPAFYKSVNRQNALQILAIPPKAKVIGLFSTSADEFSHVPRFGGTSAQFQLVETIARALEGTDVYLVVRHHPHMAGSPTSSVEVTGFYESYLQALTRSANVRVIMPSDQLSSYALFPYLTGAIAPYSSIARELTAFGIPTLVNSGSDSAFDDRYILDDWSDLSVKAAIEFLTSSHAHLRSRDLRRFNRKCYSILFRTSVEFSSIGIRDYFFPKSLLRDLESISPGKDAVLDRLCDHIIGGSRVHEFPSHGDRLRLANEENVQLQRQIDIFSARRIETVLRAAPAKPEPPSLAILVDETVTGTMAHANWQRLPNIQALRVLRHPPANHSERYRHALAVVRGYLPRTFKERLKCAEIILRGKNDFIVWALSMLMLVHDLNVDYVLITNPQFQFHDTSLDAISSLVKAAKLEKDAVLPLLGWIKDPQQFTPYRYEPIKAKRQDWKDLRLRLGGILRPQDVLASVIVRRWWLVEHLTKWIELKKTAEEFEEALFKEVYTPETHEPKPAIMQPVFLLQMG